MGGGKVLLSSLLLVVLVSVLLEKATAPPPPTTMSVDLTVREAWFGGFIADLEIPVNDTIADWKIDMHFKRHVTDFELEGCEAEIEKRKPGDFRKPKGGRDIVYTVKASKLNQYNSSDTLSMTVNGKVWDKYRPRDNFVVGAEFIYWT